VHGQSLIVIADANRQSSPSESFAFKGEGMLSGIDLDRTSVEMIGEQQIIHGDADGRQILAVRAPNDEHDGGQRFLYRVQLVQAVLAHGPGTRRSYA
jgi:hypothetical protein